MPLTFAMYYSHIAGVLRKEGSNVCHKHGNHAQRRRVVVRKRIARDFSIKVVGVISVLGAWTKVVDPVVLAMLCIQELTDVLSPISIERFKIGSRPSHDDEAISDIDEVQVKAQLGVDISCLWTRHYPSHKVGHPAPSLLCRVG
jgi:hypothetical protein